MQPRLFVPAALAAEQPVTLAAGQVHYLRTVLRRRPGDEVLLFNGRDGEWRARLDSLGKSDGSARPLQRSRDQPPPPATAPWLCFAPVKRGPIDLIAEKATELGAARLVPVLTRFTDASRVNTARLTARTIEAAEQCGRLDVPAVAEPQPFDRLLADWPADRALIVCAERGPARPIAEVAAAESGRPVALMIGPEGGYAAGELDALGQLDFVRFCHLGPRLLRAETAAIAALACWQAVGGDGRAGRTGRAVVRDPG